MSSLSEKDVQFLVECLQNSDGGFPRPDFKRIKELHADEGLQINSYAKRWSRLVDKLTTPSIGRSEDSVTSVASPIKRVRGPMTPKRAISPIKPDGEGLPAFRGFDKQSKAASPKKPISKSPRKRKRVATPEDSDSVPEPQIESEGELEVQPEKGEEEGEHDGERADIPGTAETETETET